MKLTNLCKLKEQMQNKIKIGVKIDFAFFFGLRFQCNVIV